MAAAEVAAGDRCFVEEDYGTAITHYTKVRMQTCSWPH
jgi:hypothetical protein